MGGTGGGICYNDEEFKEIVGNGLHYSPATQCLIENQSLALKKLNMKLCDKRQCYRCL